MKVETLFYLQNWDSSCASIILNRLDILESIFIENDFICADKYRVSKNISIFGSNSIELMFDTDPKISFCNVFFESIELIADDIELSFRKTEGSLKISGNCVIAFMLEPNFASLDLTSIIPNLNNCAYDGYEIQQILLELYDRGIAKFRPDQLTLLSEREAKKKNVGLKKEIEYKNVEIKTMKENPTTINNNNNIQGDLIQGDKVVGDKIQTQNNNPNLIQNILNWSSQNKYLTFGIFIFLLIFIYLLKDSLLTYFVTKK